MHILFEILLHSNRQHLSNNFCLTYFISCGPSAISVSVLSAILCKCFCLFFFFTSVCPLSCFHITAMWALRYMNQ